MRFPAEPFSASRSRRRFLTTTSLAAAAVWASRAEGRVLANPSFSADPFALGVASGEPTPDGVVLWTRLAQKPLEPGGGMPQEAVEVSWEIADDEAFTKGVRRGTVTATPDWAHSVHVELTGLTPGRWYFYRLACGAAISAIGRTRTAPAADRPAERLAFGMASCQNWEEGLYTAYGQMAKDDLDLILHLGDYIYEHPARDKKPRRHGPPTDSLAGFRARHALYKTDPLLQAAHAACPWVVTWDDHEVENDYAGVFPALQGSTPEGLLERRAWGYRAYWEHLPLRVANLPDGPGMRLYRGFGWGSLAEFAILDTRQYRTDQPCGNGIKAPCGEELREEATLTGAEQEAWLLGRIHDSGARWNFVAQQVMMARIDRASGPPEAYSMDQWPGYERQRQRVLEAIAARPEANGIVLAGDIHSHWANDLVIDFDGGPRRVVAAELVGTSISSGGNGTAVPPSQEAILAENPVVRFHSQQRGYVRVGVTPEAVRADFEVVDFIDRPGGTVSTAASFRIENGRPGLVPA
jgi:alkaline phosphatase D